MMLFSIESFVVEPTFSYSPKHWLPFSSFIVLPYCFATFPCFWCLLFMGTFIFFLMIADWLSLAFLFVRFHNLLIDWLFNLFSSKCSSLLEFLILCLSINNLIIHHIKAIIVYLAISILLHLIIFLMAAAAINVLRWKTALYVSSLRLLVATL